MRGEKGGCGRNERKEDDDVDSKSPRGDMTGRFKSHLESLTQTGYRREREQRKGHAPFSLSIF